MRVFVFDLLLVLLSLTLQSGAPLAGPDVTQQTLDRYIGSPLTGIDDQLVPDGDADGFISAEEAEADWSESFSLYDADQNDELSEEEWQFEEGPGFSDLDADASGTISQGEWIGYGTQSYEEALTEMQGEQMTTRDYDEMRAWHDEPLVPSAQ